MQDTAIIACAGAGKTYTICSQALLLDGRSLMITYTNRGRDAIYREIMNQNQGIASSHITVETWFEFLLREIIRPYQSLLKSDLSGPNKIKSIDFSTTHETNYRKSGYNRWITKDGNIRQNEVATVALKLLEDIGPLVLRRLRQQYTSVFIDEFQDLAGHDLDIIEFLLQSELFLTVVGDPKQATFRTNESPANKQKCGPNFGNWVIAMARRDLILPKYLQVSRRFGSQIANLANAIDPRDKQLTGTKQESRDHQGIYLVKFDDIDAYMKESGATCLVIDKRARRKLSGHPSALNFGECKGLTFDDILIVCPGPLERFLHTGRPLTSNVAKYYIAVTRARHSVAFAVKNIDKVRKQHPSWARWLNPNKKLIELNEQLELF